MRRRSVFPPPSSAGRLLLGALAYAGAGGGQNLCQSNWIRDKGLGMGCHAPRIESPLTGEPVAAPGTGWTFTPDEANMVRWRGWWRIANIEQLSTFVAITFLTIAFTSLLAFSTLHGRAGLPRDISFLNIEGEALSAIAGHWFGRLFWFVGAFSLFAAALGIVDYTSRLAADVLRTSYLKTKSESLVYAWLVWGIVAAGIAAIASGLSQPLVLLVTSACIAAFMMFVYSALLIMLNRRLLAPELRPAGYRVAALVWAVGLFGILTAITVVDQARASCAAEAQGRAPSVAKAAVSCCQPSVSGMVSKLCGAGVFAQGSPSAVKVSTNGTTQRWSSSTGARMLRNQSMPGGRVNIQVMQDGQK